MIWIWIRSEARRWALRSISLGLKDAKGNVIPDTEAKEEGYEYAPDTIHVLYKWDGNGLRKNHALKQHPKEYTGLQIRGSKFRSSSSKFRELELQNFRARSRLYKFRRASPSARLWWNLSSQ